MMPAQRPAVVLLHGLCSSALEVRLFGRVLREHGYHVITPRVPGYTVDAHVTRPTATFETWIEAVTAEIQRVRRDHGPVHLCGVSLGATLGLGVAAHQLEGLASLTLISTTLFFDGWNVTRWRFLLPLACYTPLGRLYCYRETWPYGVKNERVRAWIEAQFAGGELSAAGAATIPMSRLREADRLIRYVKRSLHHVRAPVLMIHARDDDVASLTNLRFVARKVASPVVRLAVVEDSYHMIPLDNDRNLAALRTVQFYNGLAQASRAHPFPDPLNGPMQTGVP
jgi:carboxylesterase